MSRETKTAPSLKLGNLSAKMSLVICALVLVVMFIGGLGTVKVIRLAYLEKEKQDVETVLRTSLSTVYRTLWGVEMASQALSDNEEMLMDPAACSKILRRFVTNNDNVTAASVFYSDYFVSPKIRFYEVSYAVADANGTQKEFSINSKAKYQYYADENWLFSAKMDLCWWSEPYNWWSDHLYNDSTLRESASLVCFSRPLHRSSDGEIYGSLNIEVTLKTIADFIRNSVDNDNIDIYIKSRRGNYVIQPRWDFSSINHRYNTYSESVPEYGWKVICRYSTSELSKNVRTLVYIMELGMAIIFLALIAGTLIGVKHIARPYMERMREDAEKQGVMDHELLVASQVQSHMLPPSVYMDSPQSQNFRVYATIQPALQVGGDLYYYQLQDGKFYFCIGDVCGKGISAAIFMSCICSVFKTLVGIFNNPADITCQMNRLVSVNNVHCMFCTMFIGVLHLATGKVEYCNAGHNPPVVVPRQGGPYYLDSEGDGVVGAFEDEAFHTESIQLQPTDCLLLYTDGVTEAASATGKLLGEGNLLASISSHEPGKIVDGVLSQVKRHAANAIQSDDITMLCIRYK